MVSPHLVEAKRNLEVAALVEGDHFKHIEWEDWDVVMLRVKQESQAYC